MRTTLEQGDAQVVLKTARAFDVDEDKLWDMYQAVMKCNFEQDLWDIAKENEEFLKGEENG